MKRFLLSLLLVLSLAFPSWATVSSSTSRVKHACNNSVTAFAFTFGVNATSEVQVIYTNAAGIESPPLTETTNYTVTCTNDDCSSGGTVTTVSTYASGTYITIIRNVPLTQEADFTENMATLYETFEDGLDKLTRVDQQLQEQITRTPKLSKSSAYAATGYTFPDPEAGKVIGWNAGATDLSTFTTSSGTTIDITTLERISDYSNNLVTAVNSIGASEKTLLIDVTASCGSNLSVPSNINLWFIRGGSVSISAGVTLTPYSRANIIKEIGQQVYNGAGYLVYATNLGDQYLEDFGGKGDDSTLNTTAFASAIAAQTNPSIQLLRGTYRHAGITATTKDSLTIKGHGRDASVLKHTTNTEAGITLTTSDFFVIEDLTVDNNTNGTFDAVSITGSTYGLIKRVNFKNQGGTTKYALYATTATNIALEDLFFYDANAGHIHLYNTPYARLKNISSGYASALWCYKFNITDGLVAEGLYTEVGDDGSIYVLNSRGVTITGLTMEASPQALPLIQIEYGEGVHINGGTIKVDQSVPASHVTGEIIDIIASDNVSLENLTIWRYTSEVGSDDTHTFITIESDASANKSSNIALRNIILDNKRIDATTQVTSTGVTCVAGADNVVYNLTFENIKSKQNTSSIDLSHSINANNFIARNVWGAITFLADIPGAVFENVTGVITQGAVPIIRLGQGAFSKDYEVEHERTLSGASTALGIAIPTNSILLGVVMNVDTAVTFGGGGATWAGDFSGGSAVSINTGTAATKNTKVNVVFDISTVDTRTTGETDITFTPNAGTFTAGKIRAVVRYRTQSNLPDA